MFNFFVSFVNFIPMKPCLVMVDRVISIIEKEKIQKPGKVSGMIPLGFFVGVNVLDVIKY